MREQHFQGPRGRKQHSRSHKLKVYVENDGKWLKMRLRIKQRAPAGA